MCHSLNYPLSRKECRYFGEYFFPRFICMDIVKKTCIFFFSVYFYYFFFSKQLLNRLVDFFLGFFFLFNNRHATYAPLCGRTRDLTPTAHNNMYTHRI